MFDANHLKEFAAVALQIPGWPQEAERIALGSVREFPIPDGPAVISERTPERPAIMNPQN